MENNKKYFKKLIRNYLELRKIENESGFSEHIFEKSMSKIENIMRTIKKIYNNNLPSLLTTQEIDLENSLIETLDKDYSDFDINEVDKIIIYIRKYCIEKMNSFLDFNLEIEKKKINHEIFLPIEEGNLDAITISESYNDFKIFNNDGSTPLHLCVKNGDTTILKKFLKNGESIDLNNKSGHSLLEYACELKDPNLISFLIHHGANPKKHIFFRENNKDCKMQTNDIDLANIIKICLQTGASFMNKDVKENLGFDTSVCDTDLNDSTKTNLFSLKVKFRNLCFSKIESDYLVGLGNLNFGSFFDYLELVVFNLNNDYLKSYLDIINEEFGYSIKNRLGCPNNYFEILLINLHPFIEYNFDISTKSVILNELINTVKFTFEKNNMKIDKNFSEKLLNKLWKDYKNILPYDFIGINLSNIFSKIKNIKS